MFRENPAAITVSIIVKLNNFNGFVVVQIKVAVYNNGVEKANVIFDGHNTGRDNWFDPNRIISSTFSDIRSQQQFLQMAGYVCLELGTSRGEGEGGV